MLYIVKGMFQMAVQADSAPEAKHEAERVLKGEGVKAVALEATENGENGNGRKKGDAK